MSSYRCLCFASTLMIAASIASSNLMAQSSKQLVRLALIEVDTLQLESYYAFLKEEVEASIEKEPGVITLYAMAEKDAPERVTLFETYADTTQYKSHLTTPHFQKYKQGTAQMVKHLALIETQPILYIRKPDLSKVTNENLVIRLIRMEIESNEIENFKRLAQDVMLPGIKAEQGVLVMYAVTEKKTPTRISILEIYTNYAAYEKHLNTSHYLKYKVEALNMIKSMELIDVTPIALGSKPQK